MYEEKVDGWRILAYKDGDRVRFLELRGRRGVPGAHPVAKRSVQRVYFFGGETLMSFVTLTTPSVSFASRSASALACSFGTVPFR